MEMKILFFDVDDILLDFKLVEKKVLYVLFEEENVLFIFEVELIYYWIN